MLSDILRTGFECDVLNGKIQPGSTVAIVGAGRSGSRRCLPHSSIRPLGSS
jgi:threonine dehydrogenase-like Zn-dependent dehydrogenase